MSTDGWSVDVIDGVVVGSHAGIPPNDDELHVDSEGWLLFSIETDEGALLMRVPPWVMERVWGPRKESP